MVKKILIHLFVGALIIGLGLLLHLFGERSLADAFAIAGFAYASCGIIFVIFTGYVRGKLNAINKSWTSKKAREDLLSFKKLMDEGILTKEEFDEKSTQLKKLIL